MSKPLVTVKPDVTVAKAARLMIKAKIKKLPVADSDHLLGILSLTDLVPLLKEEASTTKFRISDAPDRVKRVFETFIDPETHQRKKCPLIILGGMPVGCLGSKCMWYDAEGCVFKTFTMKLAATRSDHQQ
jgi:CBS-domain-containing membrane protein